MAPTRYSDVPKKATNLLTDDYNFDRKFKLVSKSASGISFTSEGTLAPKKVDAKLTVKFSPAPGVSVDKAQITSAGRVVGEATFKGVVKNTDVVVKVQDGAGKAPSGEVEVKYTAPKFTIDSTIDVVQGPSLTLAGTVAPVDKWVVGATAKYNTNLDAKKDPVFEDYGVTIAHQTSDATLALATKSKVSAVSLTAYVEPSDVAQVAFQADASLKSDAKLADVALAVGGVYVLDKDSKVQAKVDSKGIVSANYHITLRPNVKGIASAQVDALQIAGDNHKFGLSLILG